MALKPRYEIFNAVNAAWNDGGIYTFEQFEAHLKVAGVGIEYKYCRGTNQIHGLWYTRKGKKFPASKIDRRFSYGNIVKHLANNKPLHPKSNFMYLDGTIRPIYTMLGVRLSAQQLNDYVSGKAIRLDGCSGNYPTLYVRFDSKAMKPRTYRNNPDNPEQTVSSHSFSAGQSSQTSSPPQEEQGFAHGGGLSWPEFRALHPELSAQEALKRFRAMKRGQNPNAMGGMHM